MRIGSLFSGYGGLDLALRAVFPDAELAFVRGVRGGIVTRHACPRCRAVRAWWASAALVDVWRWSA